MNSRALGGHPPTEPHNDADSGTSLTKITWKLAFAVLPHRCCYSGKLIWLEPCYRGRISFINEVGPIKNVKTNLFISHHTNTILILRGAIR
jgi:hypothetical protein